MHGSQIIPNDFQNAANSYGAPLILTEVMWLQMWNGRSANVLHKWRIA